MRSQALQRSRRNHAAVVGALLLAALGMCALLAPLLAPYDPFTFRQIGLEPPGSAHWLGTDEIGRDVLSRLLYGARVSLCVGIFADGTYGAGWNGVGYMAYAHATLPPDQAVSTAGVTGLLYGDVGQFWAQCIGTVACTAWNVIVGGIVFIVLGFITPKRVPAKVEIAGLDLEETGIAGYPSFMTHTYADQISDADVAAAMK